MSSEFWRYESVIFGDNKRFMENSEQISIHNIKCCDSHLRRNLGTDNVS